MRRGNGRTQDAKEEEAREHQVPAHAHTHTRTHRAHSARCRLEIFEGLGVLFEREELLGLAGELMDDERQGPRNLRSQRAERLEDRRTRDDHMLPAHTRTRIEWGHIEIESSVLASWSWVGVGTRARSERRTVWFEATRLSSTTLESGGARTARRKLRAASRVKVESTSDAAVVSRNSDSTEPEQNR